MSEALQFLSFDEFLDIERDSKHRHEYVGGRMYAMAGGTERHDLMAGFLFARLLPGAVAAGCRPFNGNRLVQTPSGSTYYPDVMVACGSAPHLQHETDPVVIVEVLSPSTAAFDRREKTVGYAACRSVETSLLVSPDERRIERARIVEGRVVGWDVLVAGDMIFTRFASVGVDELYDQLDATATT